MTVLARIAVFATVVVGSVTAVPAASAATRYFYCSARAPEASAFYVSPVFAADWGEIGGAMNNRWRNELDNSNWDGSRIRYDFGSSRCLSFESRSEANNSRVNMVNWAEGTMRLETRVIGFGG